MRSSLLGVDEIAELLRASDEVCEPRIGDPHVILGQPRDVYSISATEPDDRKAV
jgi:hypothetical protein